MNGVDNIMPGAGPMGLQGAGMTLMCKSTCSVSHALESSSMMQIEVIATNPSTTTATVQIGDESVGAGLGFGGKFRAIGDLAFQKLQNFVISITGNGPLNPVKVTFGIKECP